MNADLTKQIYGEVKHLFPDGAVKVRVARPVLSPELSVVVKLVHISTGIEVICDEFRSQTENYIAAAIRLRIACDKHAAKQRWHLRVCLSLRKRFRL